MKRLIAIVTLACLLLSGCASAAPVQTPAATAETPVFLLAGKVQASETADLSAPFTGRVESVIAQPGQHVKAGEALVKFDSSEVIAQVNVTKEAFEAAKATYEKAKAGARPEQLLQAEAALKSATVARDNAKNNLDRQEALYKNGTIAINVLEAAQVQAAATEAARKNAEEALAILKTGETKAYFAVLEKQVAQAEAAVKSGEVSLNNRTIKAPFDGYVTAVNVRSGETYTASTVLVSIENRDRLSADTYGPATVVHQFALGDTVKIRTAEHPEETFSGKVAYVGGSVDAKRRDVLVKISLDPSKDVLTGMYIEVAPSK